MPHTTTSGIARPVAGAKLPDMKQKISKALVEALECPPGKRDMIIFDTEITGFGVRVTEAGRKRFLLQYTRKGVTKRLPLGKYDEVKVSQARHNAILALAEVTAGNDPAGAREARIAAAVEEHKARALEAEADAFTVQKLLDAWEKTGLKAAGARHKAESPRAIAKLLAAHLDRPARELTPEQAQAALDDLAHRAPVMAIRSKNYAKAAFNWAARRKLIPANPFAEAVVEAREKSRDRVLSDAELGEAWRAAGTLNGPWRQFFQVLMLTLQRRNEVAEMEWSELAPDLSTWSIPAGRAKNGRAHVVHLSAPAREAIQSIRRFERSKYVFTTDGKVPIAGFTRARSWLEAAILKERAEHVRELPALDWTLHDFRRTGVTALAGLGVSVFVADRLLNHISGAIRGVMSVYQRSEFLPERQQALDAWAVYVLEQAAKQPKT